MSMRKRLEKPEAAALEAAPPATTPPPSPGAGMTPGQLQQLPAGELLPLYRLALGGGAAPGLPPAGRKEYERLAKLPAGELRREYEAAPGPAEQLNSER